MNGDAAKHVQAYIEYRNIVGNDDGGQMMNEAEFEAYKARARREGKLDRDFSSLADAEDRSDLMNPKSIMANMIN